MSKGQNRFANKCVQHCHDS